MFFLKMADKSVCLVAYVTLNKKFYFFVFLCFSSINYIEIELTLNDFTGSTPKSLLSGIKTLYAYAMTIFHFRFAFCTFRPLKKA